MTEDTPKVDITEGAQPEKAPEITKAVALEYEAGQKPKITASGKGAIAEQILAIAFANGVKVRQDADLTEVLSKLDVDSPIPVEAFAAVAEILSYVYQANAALKQQKGLS